MRRLLGSLAMTLVVSGATLASASDATKLIYDLADLEPTTETLAPRLQEGSSPTAYKHGNRPSRNGEGSIGGMWDNDSEMDSDQDHGQKKHHGSNHGASGETTSYSSPGPDGNSHDAMPNPEPGSMILLGSGLAAGARYLRRRRKGGASE